MMTVAFIISCGRASSCEAFWTVEPPGAWVVAWGRLSHVAFLYVSVER